MGAPGLSRRRAISTAAGVGLGLPVLAACGGDDISTGATDPSPTAGGAAPTAASSASASSGTATAQAPSGSFASTADIPVGGGGVFEEQQVVVTQPTEGEFKGFSFVCTHSGCPVNQVTDEILCPCHGSRFSLTDGSPTAGPAASPLAPVALVVDGDSISLA